jgi:hypothetical protein
MYCCLQKEWLEADVNDWGFLRFDVDGDEMVARFIRSSNGEERGSLVTQAGTPS